MNCTMEGFTFAFLCYFLLYGVSGSHLLQYHPGKRTLFCFNLALFTNQEAFIRSLLSYLFHVHRNLVHTSFRSFLVSVIIVWLRCPVAIPSVYSLSFPLRVWPSGPFYLQDISFEVISLRDKERMRIVLDNVN